MNVACISESTYHRHIKSYVNPTIIQQWKAHQQHLFNSLSSQDNGLVLAGDGRNINVFSHFITFYYCVSFYYERVRTNKMNPVDFFSCWGNAIVWNVTTKIPLVQRDVASDVKFSHFLLEEIIMVLFWHQLIVFKLLIKCGCLNEWKN